MQNPIVLSHPIIYDTLAYIHHADIVIFAAGRKKKVEKLLRALKGLSFFSFFKLTPNRVTETTHFTLIQ